MQTCIPNLSSTSYIEITGDIEFIQWLVQERIWGDKTHTILQESKCQIYQAWYRVWYHIWYLMWYQIRYGAFLIICGGCCGPARGAAGWLRFLVFAEQKKSSSFQQNAFDVLGIRTPDCRCKSGYMSHSAIGAVYLLKKTDVLISSWYDTSYQVWYQIKYLYRARAWFHWGKAIQ